MKNVSSISQQVWDMKYRLKAADGQPVDKTMDDTFRRVADALAAPEDDAAGWADRFFAVMRDFQFLPGGRILSGAGSDRDVTLFNCFVMGDVPDDMSGIFDALREAALTMQQGGGIGYDFSTLRPKGAPVRGVGADASGPLSFMDVWDAMCRTIMSAGSRRGAMMAVMRCDHPDIVDFIEAKKTPGRLNMFNLSVLVSDAFMLAVKEDATWQLVFEGTVYKSLPARELWDTIMRATFAYAEPGVIFIDRINALNPLAYLETIHATNPCGEQPLPPYGACLLGSVNLARLVEGPFGETAHIDEAALSEIVATAVRMLDNAIDISRFPLAEQENEARAKRRIGLGITGLADALIMCGARYGSADAVRLTESWMATVRRAAYRASVELAREKGAFPLFDAAAYLGGAGTAGLDADIRGEIEADGIRNGLLTSIAPTGTISLLADNVSSGLEPVFSFTYTRHVLMPDGDRRDEEVSDYAYRLFRRIKGEDAVPSEYFVDSQDLSTRDHLVMQAAIQKFVDSSISKTINCPESISFEEFKDVYMQAYDLGCKGCTTYRPNEVTGAVLEKPDGGKPGETDAEPELPFGRPGSANTKPVDAGDSGPIRLFQPLERPEVLEGATYKVRWPESDHALYITLTDIIDDQGRRRPFEVFINSKNTEHYAWTVALTRMISAVFRRGGDVSFVVEELKAVFDPRGGQWMGGKYVPSLLAAIGEILEQHMVRIGFLPHGEDEFADESARQPKVVNLDNPAAAAGFRQCPKCGQASLIRQEGCDTCTSCTYSRCG
ncbi:MAG: adenosylcobalamin-dependent ribonucleoside-diphosphate reductase [Rhodospirillales bacterium]|jgi:ribonucleoside-diphosphate reductase alpha chain|nr:ribonucleoside-diphosphate reductase, adenosylcobalamin-dependent [Rhodospirillaceae bacterium]MDP6429822.1 adenosylcobalamin-dependent ribonucleoside-diphosphate reductase [Rhodospirillales bacterium]MDP6645124.1 adenosylcobalamin-dependent ribonucleoside-diphosphate reductase [Rhodospirillales bacterium]MDP6841240.1 adenosylcobalamin-dependent ribonucleoside-diphosphate reductase [Rhodospirillales bacterium]